MQCQVEKWFLWLAKMTICQNEKIKWLLDETLSWWKNNLKKMSSWWNGNLARWQFDKKACWWNVKLMKCQVGKMAVGKMAFNAMASWEKCFPRLAKMTICQNERIKWLLDETLSWWKKQFSKMSSWWNGKLTKWQFD